MIIAQRIVNTYLNKSRPLKYLYCQSASALKNIINEKLENKYSDVEKEQILKVINESDVEALSRYDITKARVRQIKQYVKSNTVKNISDVEIIEGFSEKSAKKFFDSIVNGTEKVESGSKKIKGQILYPNLLESVRQNCKSVLAVYVTVNSVSWTLIDKDGYEVTEWEYYGINYPSSKKLLITDILNIAWHVSQMLPQADIYVMQAEATTLRAAGSDPNNPKVISVNLQKSQLISMIVTLINMRSGMDSDESSRENTDEKEDHLNHKVYFLRPTLPYRLYGTLVGNERVATNQTVEMLLQNIKQKPLGNSHAFVCDQIKSKYMSRRDLEKDMLGHCLLLGLTFMDLCIYRNQDSINALMRRS